MHTLITCQWHQSISVALTTSRFQAKTLIQLVPAAVIVHWPLALRARSTSDLSQKQKPFCFRPVRLYYMYMYLCAMNQCMHYNNHPYHVHALNLLIQLLITIGNAWSIMGRNQSIMYMYISLMDAAYHNELLEILYYAVWCGQWTCTCLNLYMSRVKISLFIWFA